MKSLRMAILRGRPCRAERAANGVSLFSLAASPRGEKAERGAEKRCEGPCAAALALPPWTPELPL